jgi:hypothetical protein
VIYKSAHRKFKPAINSLRPAKKAEHPLPAGVESEFLTQMRILAMWHKLHKSKEYGRVDFLFYGAYVEETRKDAQQLHLIAVAIHNTAFSRTFLVSLVCSDNLPSVPTYTIEGTRLHH